MASLTDTMCSSDSENSSGMMTTVFWERSDLNYAQLMFTKQNPEQNTEEPS